MNPLVFSPDGRWVAYVSDESGRSEVYVRPFPGPGTRTPISIDGGTAPLWFSAPRHTPRHPLASSLVPHTEEAVNPGERERADADHEAGGDSAPERVRPCEFPDSENRGGDGNEEADHRDPERKRHN